MLLRLRINRHARSARVEQPMRQRPANEDGSPVGRPGSILLPWLQRHSAKNADVSLLALKMDYINSWYEIICLR